MPIDDTIEEIGLPATIIRAAGNISTHFYVKPKLKSSPFDYEGWAKTADDIVSGDLVIYNDLYYLIVGVSQDKRVGDFFKNNIRLFRCDASITLKTYVPASKTFTDSPDSIPCLILDGGIAMSSDAALVTPNVSGTDKTHYLYCQPNDIDRKTVFKDQHGTAFKAAGSPNRYFAKGLIEISVKAED